MASRAPRDWKAGAGGAGEGGRPAVVMSMAKITAGDGYLYLTRHVALGDAPGQGKRDAAAYYSAQGNPPGRWTGRGAPLLGLAGRQVTEDQMRMLFGHGAHPDGEAMITAYIGAHTRHGMTDVQLEKVRQDAIRHATLGRQFPAYKTIQEHEARVAQRLQAIREEAGRDPTAAEEKKVRAEESRRHRAPVAGFDLAFTPVKSASLLWALDERPQVRDAIRQAHQDAIADALDLLEDHAAYTRTGTGGIAQITTSGLTAAAFEHWDSRAGDPNLHTHVAISAKVQGADGTWRALDARGLYHIRVAASERYNTAFEARLSAALGTRFTARPGTGRDGKDPIREIDGVPATMITHFSHRRAAIEARYNALLAGYRARHGHDPSHAVSRQLAQQATLQTRGHKQPPRSLAGKRAAWRQELDERFGPGAAALLMAAVPASLPARREAPDEPDLDLLAERAIAGVAARRSTWTRWNVHAEAERVLRARLPQLDPERHRDLAGAITDLALSPRHSICVEAPALLDEPAELRRADGESVFTVHGAGRYTSQAVLDAEERLLNATRTPTAGGIPAARAAAALDGFEARSGTRLDAGQRSLVTAFACDERLLLAGLGPAGSGKTTAMRAFLQVLRQDGRRLIPLATSAAAADVLGRELGVDTENLHKFLHEWTDGRLAARLRHGQPVPPGMRMFALHPGDVVLIDEAGMAGTFPLDAVAAIAASRGASVRLLGDDRQLAAVESGGALRLVASQPGTPQLSVLHRFRDPAEAAATLQVRAGDGTAVDWYCDRGRVRSGSREAMTCAAYDGWKADMLAGKVTLMAAFTRADVAGLAARARADRVLAGQVEGAGVALHDGNLAGAGDWIITRRNDRRLPVLGGTNWVKNGDAWHVDHRMPDGSLMVRNVGHGGRVILPAAYVASFVELLYATTAHRAQGDTVDTAHPLITAGMTREALYVLASRARERTTLYVATHDQPFDDDPRVDRARIDPLAYAAREVLLNIIATDGAILPATETITVAQQEAGSLATLVPQYLHVAHADAAARYATAAASALGPDEGDALVADPAWGAVTRRLYDAEGDGWDPARLLSLVAGQRELGSADSVAEVLSWRIDGYLTEHPSPPVPGRLPLETAAVARERLTAVAESVLGPQFSSCARREQAWPALISALRRAEDADFDAGELLAAVAGSGGLRTARSASEVLAWRVNRYLAAHPADASPAAPDRPASDPGRPVREVLLPWVQRPDRDGDEARPLGRWLTEAGDLITARVDELAATAVRHRPPWMLPLGQPPHDPEAERQWLRHVAVIAAYRDQHKVMSDDPRQVLGPYPEAGRAGHKAYWQAAESVLAARRFAGLDAPAVLATAEAQARVQVAADLYRALPADERTAISTEMAARLGPFWFGNRTAADEEAALQPVQTTMLTRTLAERGHITLTREPVLPAAVISTPVEAQLSRRGPARKPLPARKPPRVSALDPAQQREQLVRPDMPTRLGREHRF
jgi:conjugative relaxase-like TrwC/TraI family protein